MKKKNLLTIIIMLGVFIFNSCEEDLSLDVDVKTTFKKTITTDIQSDLKNGLLSDIPFYNIDTLDITDNEKLKENIDRFKDLEINKINCKLTGIPENESITELNILIPEAYISVTLNNVSENNNTVELDITPELLNTLATFLYANYKVTIQVSGFSTYAPMQLGVELSFESTIVTQL